MNHTTDERADWDNPRDILAVKVIGTLDPAAAEALRRELSARLAPDRAQLVLDFQQKVALSVVGLGAVLSLAAQAQALGGSVRLRGLALPDREALALLGLGDLVAVEDEGD